MSSRILLVVSVLFFSSSCGNRDNPLATTGTSTTSTVTASVPTIITQPSNQSVMVGATATFSAAATGTAPLAYQWFKGKTPIAGATAASYTTPAVASTDSGAAFNVTVTNSAGSVTSNDAILTIEAASNSAPIITIQPANQTVVVGQAATFLVSATGAAPLTYQWSNGGTLILGATAASYTTPATSSSDTGSLFDVTITNSSGSVTSSNATLTVQASMAAPLITAQPANQTVSIGQTATFTVTATGTAPLAYQWSKGTTVIAGAVAASFTTPATTSADSGSTFSVTITNGAGSAISNAATLTVQGSSTTQTTDITTYKYDVSRDGTDANESILTSSNVNSNTFGLRRNLLVDGKVDAQPLYLAKLVVAGTAHNVVFVETEHDSVYAFDADTGVQLWKVSTLASGETPSTDQGCGQITPEIGITATPVIDRSVGAMYLVAMSKDPSGNYHQRIHALDVSSGTELLSGPFEITATAAGAGSANTFLPGQYAERSALLLSKGVIYASFTSHCDVGAYSSWVMSFNQQTLAKLSVLNLAPNGSSAAIWMAGGGPAADASGNLYLTTGNGTFDTTLDSNGFPSKQDYGNAFVKIVSSSGVMTVGDYFTMSNTVAQSNADLDLGSGGIMLLPDLADVNNTVQHLAIGAGKDGNMYVVSRDNMGKFNASTNNIYQQLTGALGAGVWATPAYFNGTVYYGEQSGSIKAFPITKAKLAIAPGSQTAMTFGYPGTSIVISANGTANAIVWAPENASPAVLHAFDATNLNHELYNSNQAPAGRDQFGAGNKWVAPAVADGKVFVGTQNSVAVFGLF